MMNGSEARGQQIKSQRARELEELRSRGVAKSRRAKLKDCKLVCIIMCGRQNEFHDFVDIVMGWVLTISVLT